MTSGTYPCYNEELELYVQYDHDNKNDFECNPKIHYLGKRHGIMINILKKDIMP